PLFFLLSFIIIYIFFKNSNFKIIFNLYDVYKIRSNTIELPLILEYLFSMSKILFPLLFLYFKERKKNIYLFSLFFLQLFSFWANGMKSVLFLLIITFIIYFFYSKKRYKRISYFFSYFLIISLLEKFLIGTMFFIDFLIRRLFFLTNLLNFYYVDFFLGNPPDYFKQSILRYFGFESNYRDINYLIGDIYFNKPEMHANSGLISDAFANLGFLGIVIFPLLISILLYFLDIVFYNKDSQVYLIFAIYIVYVLISSFLLTGLLTHGILLLMIITIFIRFGEKK
ncbi:hypothetical protein FUSO3_09745, partial [Fusobacterium necrophorum BL]